MKKFIWLFLLIFIASPAWSQILEPVKWSFDSKDIGNKQYELTFTAKIDNGWYVYSQNIDEGGPVPTSFTIEEGASLKGDIKEIGQLKQSYDKLFEMEIRKYPKKVDFVATVEAAQLPTQVKGYLTFMTCNDERCLPPEDVDFSFDLKASSVPKGSDGVKTGTRRKESKYKPQTDPKVLEQQRKDREERLNKISRPSLPEGALAEKTVENSGDLLARGLKSNNGGVVKEVGEELLAQNQEAEEQAEEEPKKKKKKKKVVRRSSSGGASPNGLAAGGNNSAIFDPVSWEFETKDLGNNTYEMIAKCDIQDGWYVYSQDNSGEGPVPTSFNFEESSDIEFLEDKVREEGKLKDGFDPVFEMQVKKYAKHIEFKRKYKTNKEGAVPTGYLQFMTCNDERCLPPDDVDFAFGKDSGASGIAATTAANKGTGGATGSEQITKNAIAHCGMDAESAAFASAGSSGKSGGGKSEKQGRSLWTIFILGFLGGFAALLTPCVFPMIPLTVSFFTKSSKTKSKGIQNALIYAISIIVIYVSLGYIVTALFGADTLNVLSTNPWFNLAFFAVFVFFAISFFGYFEITLPQGLVNRVDSASDKGGLIGIFFMAFTLALVSFSCTGPIIGTLLVDAAVNGEKIGPIVGMTGFAVALALPFALFAAFPGWLNSLPRSGGWMNTVKVVLGFVELIFAMKFLSNADMVRQWGILPRELFIGIWVVLLLGLGIYLFGKIKFPHDSPIKKLSPLRMGIGALALIFALLLMPGVINKNMPVVGSLISGFPPPTFYNISNLWGGGHEGDDHHIQDLDEGIALARKTGKPILVDFTGWACVNCRKMEENVWPDEKVAKLIDQYTLVSLYVDENIPLPKEEQFEYTLNGKKKRVRTVGNKWSYLQTKCFETNSQPYYVLMNEKGEFLNTPVAYTPDIDAYASFLEQGLDNYKAGKHLFSQK